MDKMKFKTGMIYRSKTHPQFDMVIDCVRYQFNDNGKIEDYGTMIAWCNIEREKFMKFVEEKLGKNRDSTYPYAFYGECSLSSAKQRIKKYNLEYVGMSDDEVVIYNNDEFEYFSAFKDKHSKLSK